MILNPSLHNDVVLVQIGLIMLVVLRFFVGLFVGTLHRLENPYIEIFTSGLWIFVKIKSHRVLYHHVLVVLGY